MPEDQTEYLLISASGGITCLIDGFCILGAYLIDHHPEQATWVRDFIAGN